MSRGTDDFTVQELMTFIAGQMAEIENGLPDKHKRIGSPTPREIADTIIWNVAGESLNGTVLREKWVREISRAISDAYHAAASQAEQDTVTALRELLDEKGIANAELKAKIAELEQELNAANKVSDMFRESGKALNRKRVTLERERDQARAALEVIAGNSHDEKAINVAVQALHGAAVPPSEDAPQQIGNMNIGLHEALQRGEFTVGAAGSDLLGENVGIEDAPATPQDEELVITIARELYDRFVMGGWEPQDAYPQIRAWLSLNARPEFQKCAKCQKSIFWHGDTWYHSFAADVKNCGVAEPAAQPAGKRDEMCELLREAKRFMHASEDCDTPRCDECKWLARAESLLKKEGLEP